MWVLAALEEMMEAGTISQDLAVTVCKTFDAVSGLRPSRDADAKLAGRERRPVGASAQSAGECMLRSISVLCP